jgi:CubicO group peptidase (beta-lactamase class C family)
MRRLARFVLIAVAGLALLVIVAFVVLSVMYSPGYMTRVMLWQGADVQDYARFPAREVAAAAEPFTFGTPSDQAAAMQTVRDAMEASSLVDGDADAFLEEAGTQAFIVIEDDTILYERYFGGFQRDSIATSFSVAKSYASALTGIAIEGGAIGSADDPITDYLPELLARDQRFGDITIQHLLDMNSGIHYVETGLPNSDDTLTYYFDDLRSLALERTEIEEPPGQHWHYNNYNPLLLGVILERATGESVADYLAERVWARIGTEFGASWSLDSEDGFEKMESGINARPIDFAKLGRLYLEGGSWNGKEVVPEAWVYASTRPAGDEPAGYYPDSLSQPFGTISHRNYWWRIARPDGSYAYSGLGNHGQFVFVAPAERLIIVRNGEAYGIESFDWLEVFTTLADNLD